MSELTRDEVIAAVHPIDDATIAEIIATGATEAELAQACHFVAREFRKHEHRDVPVGRVGRVISILERVGARPRRGSPLGEAGSTLE
jgi:hypothetical protein